ncbi:MAG: glycosyltransferase [Acidobacteriaceae bacterium]
MRIAVLTSSYPRFQGDGTAPFVRSIAEALVRSGHQLDVVAPDDAEVKASQPASVPVHRFKYWPFEKQQIMGHGRALEADVHLKPLTYLLLPFYLMAASIALWRVTGRQKSELIHVHWVLPNGPVAALVARFRRIPYIVSLHGSDIFMAGKNRWFSGVARWVFTQAKAVTACSQELKDRASALGAPAGTELIAWGADPDIFKPASDRQALRQKLGWGDELIITALGRLVYKKGFDILLKAIPSISGKSPRLKVIIGGDGPILPELKELAVSSNISDAVHFSGRVPWNDVPDLLAATDIFVLPSIRDESGNLDGLPTVLLEAMGCGCAVIASNIGGVPLVIRDHENGLLFSPGSQQELTKALEILIDRPALRKQLGYAARTSVVDSYNWTKVAQQLENLFAQE